MDIHDQDAAVGYFSDEYSLKGERQPLNRGYGFDIGHLGEWQDTC